MKDASWSLLSEWYKPLTIHSYCTTTFPPVNHFPSLAM